MKVIYVAEMLLVMLTVLLKGFTIYMKSSDYSSTYVFLLILFTFGTFLSHVHFKSCSLPGIVSLETIQGGNTCCSVYRV